MGKLKKIETTSDRFDVYAVFNCGCKIKLSKYGIDGGERCEKHREQLSNRIIYEPKIKPPHPKGLK